MVLRDIRLEKGLTQEEASVILGVSRRTYLKYENEAEYLTSVKYNFMCKTLEDYNKIDESHGILTIKQIQEICQPILSKYNVEFCYLFGSYAKNKATEMSDVDLLVSMKVNGLLFYELIEVLRENLKKKVDLLDFGQLEGNLDLTREVFKDGIKIYG